MHQDVLAEVESILEQLTSFSSLDPEELRDGISLPAAAPSFEEIGVADLGRETLLLAVAASATDAWVLGPSGEPRAAVLLERGLLRVPFIVPLDLPMRIALEGGPDLRVPERPPESLAEPTPVQGLELVQQAIALGNLKDAAVRLREIARSVDSPVRARLATDAAELLDGLPQPEPEPRIGSCETVLAWRSWCGLVTITAPVALKNARLEGLDDELMKALERGGRLGAAIAREARSLRPDGPTSTPSIEFTAAITKLRDPGGTVALAAALTACSRDLERPLPGDVLAVGPLDDAGNLSPLGRERLAVALGAIARERPRSRVLLPEGNRAQALELAKEQTLLFAATLSEAVRLVLGEVRPAAGLARADAASDLDAAESLERSYEREQALAKARSYLATGEGTPGERLRGLWIEGACLVHLGRPEEARSAFERAWQLVGELDRRAELEHSVAAYLALAEADGFADLFRFADALSALEHGRAFASGSPSLRAKIDAFQGLVLYHAGRSDEALVLLDKGCARALPSDAPRFHCWLGQALTETGDHEEAREAIERGLVLADAAGGPAHAINRGYLLLARACLEQRRLRAPDALASANEGLAIARADARFAPYPLSALIHARGAALLMNGDLAEGLRELEGARGFKAESSFGALVNGLPEIERAKALLEREPTSDRARSALSRARELVSAYTPARQRFARELEAAVEPGVGATRALSAVLSGLRY